MAFSCWHLLSCFHAYNALFTFAYVNEWFQLLLVLSVWPDWAIFKVLGDNFPFKDWPNILWVFGYFENISIQVKIGILSAAWATFRKFGLPFIPSSGHANPHVWSKWYYLLSWNVLKRKFPSEYESSASCDHPSPQASKQDHVNDLASSISNRGSFIWSPLKKRRYDDVDITSDRGATLSPWENSNIE